MLRSPLRPNPCRLIDRLRGASACHLQWARTPRTPLRVEGLGKSARCSCTLLRRRPPKEKLRIEACYQADRREVLMSALGRKLPLAPVLNRPKPDHRNVILRRSLDDIRSAKRLFTNMTMGAFIWMPTLVFYKAGQEPETRRETYVAPQPLYRHYANAVA